MMCARLPPRPPEPARLAGRLSRWAKGGVDWLDRIYGRTLNVALDHSVITLLVLAATVGLNVYLYNIVPKGFFPQQDTGMMIGGIQADQSISFQAMRPKLAQFVEIIRADPAVQNVTGFTGGAPRTSGFWYIVLQDIRIGGRASNALYQFTLQGDDLEELRKWEPRVRAGLSSLPELADVNTDLQDKGLQTSVTFNRDAMSRLGLSPTGVDAVLNDAFGQRQVSTIYQALNQYRVVLEAAPQHWQSPESLNDVYVPAPGGGMVPLPAVARFGPSNTSLGVNHQGQFAASTVSFNLAGNATLGDASLAIDRMMANIGAPNSVRGSFQGSARAFQDSLKSQPLLILAALITIYIVLGILYESLVHPITILSTLPSAGVGAVAALLLTGTEFSIIALIGVILLIGIVKKNAIMMIDVALSLEREQGLDPREAIYRACRLRLRPIMMTTLAALFGALPLALGSGDGAELRRPLGIAIVGGLMLSQLLTLYTTPVVYLALDRLRLRLRGRRAGHTGPLSISSAQ